MEAFLQKYKNEYSYEQISLEEGYSILQVNNPDFAECTLLFTSGLNKINQEVIPGSEAYANIELFFCLPEYWSFENSPWPIEWLKRIGDYVVSKKSWLGNGHTLPIGNPLVKLEPQFNAEAFVLMKPEYLKFHFGDDFVAENGFIPLAIVPIFRQELDVKLRTSHNLLFEKLASKGYDERIDTYRKSSCRKKFFGIV